MTRHLGKYEIIEEIGRGGFATVYRARDPDLDREVAIKVLDPTLMRDPSLVERFRREARAAARLRHPNIVRIHEISDAGGMLAIVMELLPGPSLREVIETEAPLSVERAVELLRPLAAALDYAHAQGLVHRDVKPSNALLDEQGQPVLTDFGLVKAAEESGSSVVSLTLSQTGMTLGTPAYMAPEQADPDARGQVDHRADLYSLGVIAYEMLAGGVPFQGNTPLAVAMGHVMKPPPSPRALNPALPEGVEGPLLKALEKRPEARFQTAAAMVRALEAGVEPSDGILPVQVELPEGAAAAGPVLLSEHAQMPERTPVSEPAGPLPPAVDDSAPALSEAESESASRPWLIPVLVWAAILVVLVVVYGLWASGFRIGSPEEAPAAPPEYAIGDTMSRGRDGMVSVYVPAGGFGMGSTNGEGATNELPQHWVNLDAFWIDKVEVSNDQYRRCVEDGACTAPMTCDWGEPTYEDGDKANHPVVCVSWFDAEAYCAWAGARLPTEAEWEKAATGWSGFAYPWGDTFDGLRLNYCDQNCEYDHSDSEVDDGYARTAPTGSYPEGASPYGALDMAGNVWEWVADWYGAYSGAETVNPTGPTTGEHRVLRGGSWDNAQDATRAAFRHASDPGWRSATYGFRCAMTAW